MCDVTSLTITTLCLGTKLLLETKVYAINSVVPQRTKQGFCVIPISHLFPNNHES